MRPADPAVVGDLERILSPDRVLSRPIDRLGRFLLDSGLADQAWLDEAGETAVARVEDAVAFAKAAPEPAPDTLYDGLYSDEFMAQQGIGR